MDESGSARKDPIIEDNTLEVSAYISQPLAEEVNEVHNDVDQVKPTGWEDVEDNGVKSFADVVSSARSSSKLNFRPLFNEDKVEDSDFVLPMAALTAVKHRFENTLVGFFVGKSVAFPLVKNYVLNSWSKFGFQKVMRDKYGVYFFKFDSLNGVEQVLQQGPWMIRNTPIILNKWTPNLSLYKDKVKKVPSRV
ncbi:retrovirus-related pol polyprotein from transposon TNT 1-94 [Tanacetum coccineum]